MTTLRLLADDLTGALDTAAEFIPLVGPVPVYWSRPSHLPPQASAGLNSGTRERPETEAAAVAARHLDFLRGADIAFKKIDSLLRGPTLAEIAACARSGLWRSCVLAPAFPFQDRITRNGRQYARLHGTWATVSPDLVPALRASGIPAHDTTGDAGLLPGVNLFNAETDQDLHRIAQSVQHHADSVLWIGTGGLAQAFAADHKQPDPPRLQPPILGLFGSDQPTTAGQLAACAPHWLEIDIPTASVIRDHLAEHDLALVSFRLPDETPRAQATQRIADALAHLANHLAPPGTVVVAGGETLHSLCNATGATALLVQGRLVPGVPVSVMQGGQWDGVTVVSKSGAFGHPGLLRELIVERTLT